VRSRRERDEVLDLCRVVLREGSKSFAQAACLFDRETRAAARLLYAWCRHCDDQIDGETLGYKAPERATGSRDARLVSLVETTRSALRGEPQSEPVFAALQRVVALHSIPERYPLELLDGFAMDLEGRRYPEMQDLFLYCYHVAGTVGLMMAHVMGARDALTLRRAADLGIALQMTNIARDVLDDARAGRVYLPLAWLGEAGVPPEEILEPRHRGGVTCVVARLLAEADRYYRSGSHGLPALRFRCAWAVAVAAGVYRNIGERVRRLGDRAWDERVIVPKARKILEVGRGLVTASFATTAGKLRRGAPRDDLWTKEPSLD
jgi:phytoene synthase